MVGALLTARLRSHTVWRSGVSRPDNAALQHLWKESNRMNRREVLASSSFGQRVAEEEGKELLSYFVETDQWKRVFNGEVDIVYGVKGAGKTAIYSLVQLKADELRERGIEVVPAENVRSDAVFASVLVEPPTSEQEFRSLWKLYFLKLITEHLREVNIKNDEFKSVESVLEQAGLIPYHNAFTKAVRSIFGTVKALEGGIKINEVSGAVEGLTVKLLLREPRADERARGIVVLDEVIRNLDAALAKCGRSVWVIMDRLDVQFSPIALETKALRGLFRTYVDFIPLERIDLKIFVRTDIWKEVTSETFREASHITRHTTVDWTDSSLLNLIMRRALHNETLVSSTARRHRRLWRVPRCRSNCFTNFSPSKWTRRRKRRR